MVGFGVDSLIEALAGVVVLWLFAARRASSPSAERRAQQLIAASFFLLAAYIGVEAIHALIAGDRPSASWVGIGLAAVTAPTMPLLARAKTRLARQLGFCGRRQRRSADDAVRLPEHRAARRARRERDRGLVVGGPLAALAIAGVAVREGVQGLSG